MATPATGTFARPHVLKKAADGRQTHPQKPGGALRRRAARHRGGQPARRGAARADGTDRAGRRDGGTTAPRGERGPCRHPHRGQGPARQAAQDHRRHGQPARYVPPRAKRARELQDEYVSTEHLLVGLAADGGQAATMLRKHGATPEALLEAFEKVRGSARVTSEDPEDTYK